MVETWLFGEWVGMNRDILNVNIGERFVGLILYRCTFQFIENIPTIDHPAPRWIIHVKTLSP